MLLNCGVGEDSWEFLGLHGGSNQSILKEISPEYSLEGLMLRLTLQYFGHLMHIEHLFMCLLAICVPLETCVFRSFLSFFDWAVYSIFTHLCLTLFNSMDCSTPGSPVFHCLLEFAQMHVHWVGDAISPSHLLPPPSPFALSFSQHPCLSQWASSSHQVAKVLELQLQHQSIQWVLRVDFL